MTVELYLAIHKQPLQNTQGERTIMSEKSALSSLSVASELEQLLPFRATLSSIMFLPSAGLVGSEIFRLVSRPKLTLAWGSGVEDEPNEGFSKRTLPLLMCCAQYFWSGRTSFLHRHFLPSVLLHLNSVSWLVLQFSIFGHGILGSKKLSRVNTKKSRLL